jgi:large subunit ribosomal protein L18
MKSLINLTRRKNRIRSRISGSLERPRLSVSISNRALSCQIIDDSTGRTLAAASSLHPQQTGTLTEQAAKVGTDIANKAKTAKITKVAFDRNGRKYHGRIKALADSARAAGLEF